MRQEEQDAIAADGTLFETANGAVMFALNFSHGTCKRPALVQLMGGGRSGRGLGGLDGAGQAGMIRAELQRIGLLREAILVARFAAPSIPCACRRLCCRGYTENPEWSDAVKVVSEWILLRGATGTVSHFHLRKTLVSRYFGIRVSFLEMADKCGVNRVTASQYFKAVADLLKAEEKLAKYAVEGILKEAMVVA